MEDKSSIQKFKQLINRQRISPKIWDYLYLLLKNNLQTFLQFKDLVLKENRVKILDVGCGFKPWLELFKSYKVDYIGVDFSKELSSADYYSSSDSLPFEDNEFDALIYSEVLEHVENLSDTLKEMRRVAKPNALCFISTPFIFPEHGIPFDYQRLTSYFYQKIFKQDEIILLKESNSSFSAPFLVFNLVIESTIFRKLAGIKHFVYIFNNLLATAIELIIKLMEKFIFLKMKDITKKQFYAMPLGYSLIVRIKK